MTVEELVQYCTAQNRVCPQPQLWNALYKLLPNTRQIGAGWEPPLPLILGGWWNSSDGEKQQRLAVHIRWADQHGALDTISSYLNSLKEDDWYHAGE